MTSAIDVRRGVLRERFPLWTPRTLGSWLDLCAEDYPDRPFVITDDRTLTYAETAAWSDRFAAGLRELGVRPGDRVGLLMANHPEFFALKFAIAKAGAVAVPFNYLYRAAELAYVIEQSGCSVLITMTEFAGLDYLAMLDEVTQGWPEGRATTLPDLRYVVVFDESGHPPAPGVLTIDDVHELGAGRARPEPAERGPDDIADLLYTSGTTGAPKGVLVTHDAVLRTAYASALTRAFEDGRRILFSLPSYHMFAYIEGLLAAMFVGGAIIPQTAFDSVRYFAGIQRHRATDILCVPTMTIALLESERRPEFDLSSLTAILSGSAPAPIWLWERARDELGVTEIVTGYGMTECGGAMTLTLPEDDLRYVVETVGRPKLAGAAGVDGADALTGYSTVDPASGAPLPAHREGELVSAGPTTMRGYWGKPAETAAVLRDGVLHSGDLGRVREDGYLEVTGRTKELYKSGGELVMPKEIEDLLSGHPGISQAFAVGVPDQRWGEAGCVCVVTAPGENISADAVIAMCRDELARFKVPKHVLFLTAQELPTTATGKVQKHALVRWAQARLAQAAGGGEG
ncbi:AMP-binding protein [Nocardia jinanensis]|uniref:AMP-binding protein n=1 Tax=Nocardia jinanensis TaxID=382504 RepID=A0A917RIH0_9NOCA|nr:AMP-binding protein [Nocardia jinanensis]GGL10039.1 AMP-binding protein [Nocardia jinanensis]